MHLTEEMLKKATWKVEIENGNGSRFIDDATTTTLRDMGFGMAYSATGVV